MSNYTRGTIWSDGANLTATDLNAEFDRIQAVINGGLEESNFAAGELEEPIVINAGDARFQTGGLDNSELVAAAIAEAVAGNKKWVFVPRTLFNYADEAAYSSAMYNTGVILIREGAIAFGFDPVAYGAAPDDATVDDSDPFDACVAGAAAAAIGGNPGGGIITVTLPGEYQLDSDVTLTDPVRIMRFPGVTFAGTGNIVNDAAVTPQPNGVHAAEDLAQVTVTLTLPNTACPDAATTAIAVAGSTDLRDAAGTEVLWYIVAVYSKVTAGGVQDDFAFFNGGQRIHLNGFGTIYLEILELKIQLADGFLAINTLVTNNSGGAVNVAGDIEVVLLKRTNGE